MTLRDKIAHVRLRLPDLKISNEQIVGFLQQGDSIVFEKLGGISNPDIAQALQRSVSDTISPARLYVILPKDVVVSPQVFAADSYGRLKNCHLMSVADAQMLGDSPGWKPCATIQKNTVTIYPSPPFKTGTREVKIVYYTPPGSMVYLGGYRGIVSSTEGFGIKGKSGLVSLSFSFPTTVPSFSANELAGGIISLQVSSTYRQDYTIEEHDAGDLTKVYVNATSTRVESEDMNFDSSQDAAKGYIATIHKGSDLPEKYHQNIIDEAVKLILGEKK